VRNGSSGQRKKETGRTNSPNSKSTHCKSVGKRGEIVGGQTQSQLIASRSALPEPRITLSATRTEAQAHANCRGSNDGRKKEAMMVNGGNGLGGQSRQTQSWQCGKSRIPLRANPIPSQRRICSMGDSDDE
jgi:hypothetical protein